MTKIIGVRDAKAINPKPSSIGLRPLIDEASPTPSAVTSGTVIDGNTASNRNWEIKASQISCFAVLK